MKETNENTGEMKTVRTDLNASRTIKKTKKNIVKFLM